VAKNTSLFSPEVPVISKQPYEVEVPDRYVCAFPRVVAVATSIKYGFPQLGWFAVAPDCVIFTFMG
jgi:hypothetical protein